MTWFKNRFHKNQIKHETDKAVLIAMPKNSAYNGYEFWHPSKVVKDDEKNNAIATFSYTDEWVFKLFKQKLVNKKWEKVSEIELTADEMREVYFVG